MQASSFIWSPAATLQNTNSLSPVARQVQTTAYLLTVYDTIGCPKPSRDTVLVTVLPRIRAFAGNDTAVVNGQPLQLQASGGSAYAWFPATGLSNSSIANPFVIFDQSGTAITYMVRVTKGFCQATDSLDIKVFKTPADIFVPSAFTPNNDGMNDLLRPILVGIKKLETFKLFNRWGQPVFETSKPGEGWDGVFNGVPQQSGTFVYTVTGFSYLDQMVVRKGAVVLVR